MHGGLSKVLRAMVSDRLMVCDACNWVGRFGETNQSPDGVKAYCPNTDCIGAPIAPGERATLDLEARNVVRLVMESDVRGYGCVK